MGTLLALVLFASCQSGANHANNGKGDHPKGGSEKLSNVKVTTGAQYGMILEDLDREELDNITRAMELFRNGRVDSLGRDTMFIAFNELLTNSMQSYYEKKLMGNRALMDKFESKENNEEATKLTAKLATYGISLTYREGEFYMEPSMEFLYEKLGDRLTEASKNYLQTKIGLTQELTAEGTTPSAPDSLAREIFAWEDYMVRYPDYILKDEILAEYTDAMAAYLSGLENLPLFDPDTKELNAQFRESYLKYLKDHPGSSSSQTVKKFYDLLASKGFKYDESIDTFVSEINFNPISSPQ
ncbi:MAG: hypothetical protein LWW85_01070 [Marinilabiliales bacterium]|nr:hypothetical protein [Marinilabiliales bacterium]